MSDDLIRYERDMALGLLTDMLGFIGSEYRSEEAIALDGHPIERGQARQLWDRGWAMLKEFEGGK